MLCPSPFFLEINRVRPCCPAQFLTGSGAVSIAGSGFVEWGAGGVGGVVRERERDHPFYTAHARNEQGCQVLQS